MCKSICVALFIFALLQTARSTCAQPQYTSSITNAWNYAPVSSLLSAFTKSQSLTDITVDATYSITGISAEAFIQQSSVQLTTGGTGQLTIKAPLNYLVTFSLTNSGTVVALGQATLQIPLANFNLVIQTANYVTWTLTVRQTSRNIFKPPLEVNIATATLTNIAFNQLIPAAQYTTLTTALNTGATSVPNQLSAIYSAQAFTDSITTLLTTATAFPSTYAYSYTNINGNQEQVALVTTPGTISSLNNVVTAPRAFEVTGQTTGQACSATGAALPATLPGTQVEVYCFEVLQSIFTYASSAPQNFFNTQLNSAWNSPIFQFSAASLSNALKGIQGAYAFSTPAQGTCTSSAASLALADQALTAGMTVNCQLNNLKSGAGENLISVTFQLSVPVTPSVTTTSTLTSSTLSFIGGAPTLTNVNWTANPNFPISNTDLAQVYLQSIVTNAFQNQPLFGSGLPTLQRTAASFQWANNQLVIFQAAQASE